MDTPKRDPFFYGWVIVATCFVAAASYGLFYTFGVFFKSLQAEFGWGRALTGSVHSVHLLIYAISTYYFGRLTDRIGPRRALSLGAVFIGVGLSLCSQIQNIWQLYLFYIIASLGSGVTVSLPNATVQKWFLKKRGLALGLIGGISILGRIGMGLISEKIGWKWGLFLSCLLSGLMLLWLIGVRSLWMLSVFAVVYGFFYGGKITTIPGLIGSFFGTRFLGEIIGAIHAVSLAGGIIGPVLGGYIFDRSGSYRIAFLIAALAFLTSAVLTLFARPPHPAKKSGQ
jgi:MFS family permease